MKTADLTAQIVEHRAAVDALSRAIDQVVASVESATVEAHDSLTLYQDRKRFAERALAEAGERFSAARRTLRAVDDLFNRLGALKDAHVELCRAAQALQDSEHSRRVRCALTEARQDLRAVYERIESCRRQADQVDDNGGG